MKKEKIKPTLEFKDDQNFGYTQISSDTIELVPGGLELKYIKFNWAERIKILFFGKLKCTGEIKFE